MENEKDPWAQAQNEQVESAALRHKLHLAAAGAVKYGHIDRDWVNAWLLRLGADPVTGYAEYRINTPVTGVYGKTVKASTRAEALEKFNQHVARVSAAGQTADGACDIVYGIEFTDAEPTFFSGPQDPPPPGDEVPGLDGLKSGIRQMLMQGVTEQGWGPSYARSAIALMGLEPLPPLVHRTVSVPVSGIAEMTVSVFEGDGTPDVQAAAAAAVARMQLVSVKPDEVGAVMSARNGSMGLTLVDDDDEDETDEDDGF
jgi:hypothetical protein